MSAVPPDEADGLDADDLQLLEQVAVGELRPDAPRVAARATASPSFRAALAETLALQATLDQFGQLAQATLAEWAAPTRPPVALRRWRWAAAVLAASALFFVARHFWPESRPSTPSEVDPTFLGAAKVEFDPAPSSWGADVALRWRFELPANGWYVVSLRAPESTGAAPWVERRVEDASFAPSTAEIAALPPEVEAVALRVVAYSADRRVLAVGVLRCARPR